MTISTDHHYREKMDYSKNGARDNSTPSWNAGYVDRRDDSTQNGYAGDWDESSSGPVFGSGFNAVRKSESSTGAFSNNTNESWRNDGQNDYSHNASDRGYESNRNDSNLNRNSQTDPSSFGFGGQERKSESFGTGFGTGFGAGFGSSSSFNETSQQKRPQVPMTGECTVVEVSCQYLGKIIGSGGSRIRELEDESGARIKVCSEEENDDRAPVRIWGSIQARDKCKALIQEITNEFKPRPTRFNQYGAAPKKEETYSRDPPKIDWDLVKSCEREFVSVKWKDCPPIKKDFYFESPDIANMHPDEANEIRRVNNNITVSEMTEGLVRPVPNPVRGFRDAFEHYPEILEEIAKQGFERPSPIQAQGWPILLKGKDLIGIAQTGTGKTLAFLLPALIHIDEQPCPREDRGGANTLILTPTRELALQIEIEVKKYSYRGIKCCCVYGGGNRREQIGTVNTGVQIIIATPGRLNDLVNIGIIDVRSITYLILDEADRMLDMGFEPQIMKTLLDVRPDRQTVMTSATWPPGVRRLVTKYMKDPFLVFVGSLDLAACHTVTQNIVVMPEEDKKPTLYEFLMNMEADDKVLVFVGKKVTADDVASDLALHGVQCQCIHGDREQIDRETALKEFRSGEVRILVATDVASRGLDIQDITHVINFDFPRSMNMEEYVHRVGRTGRAGKSGSSISFFTRGDWSAAKDLIDILVEANQEVPPELYSMAERYAAMKSRRDAEGGDRFGGRRGGFGGRRRNESSDPMAAFV